MLPEKDIGCHRTGFAKTCRECVVEHNCQLWKPLRLDANKETGQLYTDHWACIDVHAHTIGINMLGRQDTTSATVDKLAKTVAESNDQGMGGVLARINAQMQHERDARAQLTMPFEPRRIASETDDTKRVQDAIDATPPGGTLMLEGAK